MSMLEVYNALAPYSRYAVASEEVEPGVGWAYSEFLHVLSDKPEMDRRRFEQSHRVFLYQ